MSTDTQDTELGAIAAILNALHDLDPAARGRVLEYVLTRLDLPIRSASVSPVFATAITQNSSDTPSSRQASTRPAPPLDIRSFAQHKGPRSANEMAAVVAYYLKYEAPESEQKDTISKEDIERYFKLAKFRPPKSAHFTLTNSKNAGYLDQLDRGQYSLNPVGFNLVAYKLPRKSEKS